MGNSTQSLPLDVTATIRRMSVDPTSEAMPLISDLEISAAAGEFHALLGPTGAGKTTLLRILAGLEKRYEGEVRVGTEEVTGPTRRVQLMFQDHRLLPWLRVADNIAFGLPEQDDTRVEHWLRIVQLTERRNAWPKTLSGGESGRVALARAFVSNPDVILLDEPFAALDVVVRAQLRERLIAALKAHPATVLMVSHSVEDAVMLADFVHVLHTRPMRIKKSFAIPELRPRMRSNTDLLRLEAEIYATLEEG